MIGRVLSGRYIVDERVGSGGMAIVYRGRDRIKRQTVAIKVLRPEYEKDEEFVSRFSREAEAASKVSHENIVNMLDVGIDGDLRYIVMEYVDGSTLKDMIREKGPIEPRRAIPMAIRILAAVDHAHRNGIVHRDIKPQNILVDKHGIVKVADFGIARLKSSQTTHLQADGQLVALGSVHYFSPEQARGDQADEKSDLYSVGVVLYEMLTGCVPFDGDTDVAIAMKHINEQPKSMLEYDLKVTKALDEVVMRAMAKDPAQRYQTAAEMAADLRRADQNPKGGFVRYPKDAQDGQGDDRGGKGEERGFFRRFVCMAVIVAILGLLVLAGWYIIGRYGRVTVPYVVGAHEDEAASTMQETGLRVEIEEIYNEQYPSGYVVSQSLEGGTRIDADSTVRLYVSMGSQWYYLDNYAGAQENAAVASIEEAGGTAQVEYVLSDESGPGTVLAQSLEPGYQNKEQTVVLTVSGRVVTMPDLTGLTVEGAQALIEAEGLANGTVNEEETPDTASGIVIDQSVPTGVGVLAGSAIDLTVSARGEELYRPRAPFELMIPLENLNVEIELKTPAGDTIKAYQGTLPRGMALITLQSADFGEHTVTVRMNGVLMETTKLLFE